MKRVLTAAVAIPLVLAITIYAPRWIFALAVGLVSALAVREFLLLIPRKRTSVLARLAITLAGVAYCGLLGFLILMRRDAIVLLFAIIWTGDSAAYYGGRAFGRHPLAPKISPKKTVEGAICGFIGSLMVGTLGGVWFFGAPWINLLVISAVTAIAGQIGDLAESAMKRRVGVKDSSSILPGHGGILDRLDSLLFAAPVFYWLFSA